MFPTSILVRHLSTSIRRRAGRNRNTVARLQAKKEVGSKREGLLFDYSLKPQVTDWSLFSGDLVEIVKGEDKGKRGKVLSVDRLRDSLVVEGVNLAIQVQNEYSLRKKPAYSDERIPQPIHYNACRLVDPKTLKVTDFYWDMIKPEGGRPRHVRISLATNEIIPIQQRPKKPADTSPFNPELETTPDAVAKVTYEKHPLFGKSEEEKKRIMEEKVSWKKTILQVRYDRKWEIISKEKQVKEYLERNIRKLEKQNALKSDTD